MVAEPGPATDGLMLELLEGFPVDSAVSESRDSNADDSMPRKLHKQDQIRFPNSLETLTPQTRTVQVRQDGYTDCETLRIVRVRTGLLEKRVRYS